MVTVVIVSGTLPVFGEMIHDPIATVARIDNTVAVLLARCLRDGDDRHQYRRHFVSPAFDFANCAPSKISWRAGGMIAAGRRSSSHRGTFQQPRGDPLHPGCAGSVHWPLFGILWSTTT